MKQLLEFKRTNTILYCQHWEETVAFYRDKLNLEVAFQCDWLVEFRLYSSSYLSVANQSRSTISSATGKGITLSFQIENLMNTHLWLVKEGIAPTPIRKHVMGADVFYIFDPEGTRIEFWRPYHAG